MSASNVIKAPGMEIRNMNIVLKSQKFQQSTLINAHETFVSDIGIKFLVMQSILMN